MLPDKSTGPFPGEEWNGWDRKPATAANHFVCVQSVVDVTSGRARRVLDGHPSVMAVDGLWIDDQDRIYLTDVTRLRRDLTARST